jgi:hypothetical protein
MSKTSITWRAICFVSTICGELNIYLEALAVARVAWITQGRKTGFTERGYKSGVGRFARRVPLAVALGVDH